MVRTALTIATLGLVVAAGPACDRDGDESPPITYGEAPAGATDDEPATDEQPGARAPDGERQAEPAGADEQSPPGDPPAAAPAPDEAGPAPGARGTDRHVADLPEGTDEQQSMLMEGRKAFLDDDYRDAEEVFEKLAFDEPVTSETVSAAVALGQIYLETGRSDQALEMFERLEDHVSDVPEVLLVLARTYADQGHPDRAIGAYDRAFEQKRDYVFILPEMAELLLKEGDDDRAAQVLLEYEEYIEELVEHLTDPDEASVRERIHVADIFAMVSDERAHQALEEAMLEDPSERVRVQAAIALGESAAFDSRQTLRDTSRSADSESVRAAAGQALDRLREFERQFEEYDP